MKHLAFPYRLAWLAGSALLAGGACLAQQPLRPVDFAWRATLELTPGAGLARVSLPAQALLQLQTGDVSDLRVFNSAGEPVAFAVVAPAVATPAALLTRSYGANPLYQPAPGGQPPQGAVQVQVGEPGRQRSVWVRIDGAGTSTSTGAATPGAATRLPAAIFATQDEKQLLTAISVQAALPANAPVRIDAATSADLAQWTPVPLRGRLYRFEGASLSNSTLEFEQPVRLEGRYLRLDWTGQEGVNVSAVAGVVANPATARRVRAALPPPMAPGNAGLEWLLAFSTPIAALALSTPQPDSLVPVRILGRNDAAQPWRELAQTVVYRLGTGAAETVNSPVVLQGASVRWLRVEGTQGMALGRQPLEASVEFMPLQLVFLAGGGGPFELAAGRAGTGPASIPAAVLAAAAPGKFEDLPEARIGAVTVRPPAAPGFLSALWPGAPPERILWLWAVLGGGVLLLAGVAWSLFGQLKAQGKP